MTHAVDQLEGKALSDSTVLAVEAGLPHRKAADMLLCMYSHPAASLLKFVEKRRRVEELQLK